ncbi:alpha-amylase [Paenibacillus sp. FSL H7-0737]|uniref:alpha-amylase n=1 Tax=Paenibacillus sp. FSL H7-0737 TaxID=1536775 RepID=UPI0004F817B6|nr:alpha-amylase [Paenibacillus sp. FSL H7-0737]AIQ26711.1 alpha amylase [Paenibacillus sp. FSL H7-0737]
MSKESKFRLVQDYLSTHKDKDVAPIWIPAVWNECKYECVLLEKDGEICVHPYDFLTEHLKYVDKLSWRYSLKERTNLDDSAIYSSLIRYSTAWDYNHDGTIESGTFLRFLILLPLLKKMGINILYMLPVNQYSKLNLKGDIGSPYAVQSLFHLDQNLHDSLLDGMEEFTIHDELSALVEACHLLDIKTVVDFIPRVTAKNSLFITEHPEWVYWIKMQELEGFAPPSIPELGFFEECTPDKLETVYHSQETAAFLRKFSPPPNELHPILWQQLKEKAAKTGDELLTLVEQEMGITTAPAHSDWINDVQPIWTDITFLRLYKDFSPQVRHLISSDQAPYVLFDTIKCNDYPGEEPNLELWDVLEEAVRFNLEKYGIDGFRIDIGHVLPIPLLTRIFDTIKELNPNAILISEDLFNRNHKKAASTGYNIMLGSGWNVMTQINKDNLVSFLEELPELNIHVFACAETADTPRITSRGGVEVARMIAVFNQFLPNAIPYVTTGYEMNEEQPLNCGLGDNTNGEEISRAFFNVMQINWTNPAPMLPLLTELSEFKKDWPQLVKPENFFVAQSPEGTVLYGYMHGEQTLLCCFNLSADTSCQVDLKAAVPGRCPMTVTLDSSLTGSIVGQKLDSLLLAPNQALVLVNNHRQVS